MLQLIKFSGIIRVLVSEFFRSELPGNFVLVAEDLSG
jgi:hypothetical protein